MKAFAFWSALLALALAGKLQRLDRPFAYGHDEVGARYSLIARNFRRAPSWRLTQETTTGLPPPELRPGPYGTHPPGVPLLLALAFTLAGESPRTARLTLLLPALGTLLFLALLVRRHAGPRRAAATALVFTLFPGTAVYGTHVDPVSWWSVLAVAALLALSPPQTWLSVPLFLGALLVEWNALFVFPLALLEAWRRRARRAGWILLAAGLLGAALYLYLFSGRAGKLSRWVLPADLGFPFWRALGAHLVGLCGWPLLLPAAFGFLAWWRRLRGGPEPLDRFAGLLLLFQAWYSLLYPLGTRVHDFCLLYTLLPLALFAADALLHLAQRRPLAAALLLGAAGLWHAREVPAAYRRHDGEAAFVEAAAATLRRHTLPPDVIATCLPPDRLLPIAYAADRFLVGGVTTPAALRELRRHAGPRLLFFAPRPYLALFPDLAARLGVAPRGSPFVILRPPRRRRAQAGPLLPPPSNVCSRRRDGFVELTWTPLAHPQAAGYRVFFGDRPGVYPIWFDVPAPPFRYRAETQGRVHYAVAALDRAGRAGRLSPDGVLVLAGGRPLGAVLLTAAALASLLLALQLFLLRTPGGAPLQARLGSSSASPSGRPGA